MGGEGHIASAHPPAADQQGCVDRRRSTFRYAHHGNPVGADHVLRRQPAERCDGVVADFPGSEQALVAQGMPEIPGPVAIDNKGGDPCVAQSLCIVDFPFVAHSRAGRQYDDSGRASA